MPGSDKTTCTHSIMRKERKPLPRLCCLIWSAAPTTECAGALAAAASKALSASSARRDAHTRAPRGRPATRAIRWRGSMRGSTRAPRGSAAAVAAATAAHRYRQASLQPTPAAPGTRRTRGRSPRCRLRWALSIVPVAMPHCRRRCAASSLEPKRLKTNRPWSTRRSRTIVDDSAFKDSWCSASPDGANLNEFGPDFVEFGSWPSFGRVGLCW